MQTSLTLLPIRRVCLRQLGWSSTSLFPNFVSPAASWLSLGLSAISLKQLPGLVRGSLLGWTWVAQTIDPTTQVRSTSESLFLHEAFQINDNLIVQRDTLAKKVVFDVNRKIAGVIVDTAGLGSGSVDYTIHADREVHCFLGKLSLASDVDGFWYWACSYSSKQRNRI